MLQLLVKSCPVCQREAENYIDPFVVVVMKDDNRTKCVATYMHLRSETFIGINFNEIVLLHEKSEN